MRVIAWLYATGQLLFSGPRQHRRLLVLDLDGTLVRSQSADGPGENTLFTQGQWLCIAIRPHTREFLAFVAQHFDLAVFTASRKEYAEKVIDLLQLKVPLYCREACNKVQGGYEKDLSVLQRPLRQVLLLDDNPISYRRYPNNGLKIPCWEGDQDDNELLRIMRNLSNF